MTFLKSSSASFLWAGLALVTIAGPSCSSAPVGDDSADSDGAGGRATGGKGDGGKPGKTGGRGSSDGGRSGSGGKGSGGAEVSGGQGGQGGEGSGGEGGAGEAGSPTAGGTGGQASGGGSSGGSAPACGDGDVDRLEQCDHGSAAGPGCSDTCTFEGCDSCRSDAGASRSDYIANYADCDDTALSAADKAHCKTVLQCIRENDCAREDVRECYCGSADFTDCFQADANAPNGLCKEAINGVMKQLLGKDPIPADVGITYFKRIHPIGVAVNTAIIDQEDCYDECYLGDPWTGGPGSGGSNGSGGASSGGASSGGASSSSACDTCSAYNCKTVFENFETRCAGGVCDDYTSCAVSEVCAEADFLECYCGTTDTLLCIDPDTTDPNAPTPNGLCKDQVTALAGTTVPGSVATEFYSKTAPLGAVNNLLECQYDACFTECF